MTQIVQHKSRDFDVVLNFPGTENTLSWAFTAETDGEIYAVDVNNVASYRISGASITLPYAVTAGASYSVSIVKQTNGQPATISFNTRRAVDKSISISVPDFGAYGGNYLFMLFDNNIIEKHDVSKFRKDLFDLSTNIYSEESLISDLVLPIPSYDVGTEFYSTNQIIACGGYVCAIGYIGVIATQRTRSAFIAKIDVISLTAYSLDNIPNSYSYYEVTSNINDYKIESKLGFFPHAFWDYIKNELIIASSSSFIGVGGLYNPLAIHIQTGVNRTPIDKFPMSRTLRGIKCLEPINECYWGDSSLIFFDKFGKYNGLTLTGSSTYINDYDAIIVAGSDNGAYHIFYRDGSNDRGQTGVFSGATNLSICKNTSIVLAGGQVVTALRGKFFLKNISDNLTTGHYVISSFGSSFSYFPLIGMPCDHVSSDSENLTFVTFLESGIYNQNDRSKKSNVLSVIDNSYAATLTASGETNGVAEAGYKVFSNKIVSICTNKTA